MQSIDILIKELVRKEIESQLIVLKQQVLEKENTPDNLVEESEAAAILKRSKTSMWRLRKDGMIPYHRYGKKVMYRQSDLNDFINKNLITNE